MLPGAWGCTACLGPRPAVPAPPRASEGALRLSPWDTYADLAPGRAATGAGPGSAPARARTSRGGTSSKRGGPARVPEGWNPPSRRCPQGAVRAGQHRARAASPPPGEGAGHSTRPLATASQGRTGQVVRGTSAPGTSLGGPDAAPHTTGAAGRRAGRGAARAGLSPRPCPAACPSTSCLPLRATGDSAGTGTPATRAAEALCSLHPGDPVCPSDGRLFGEGGPLALVLGTGMN